MNHPSRIDKHKVKHSFAQASGSYDDFAYLQRTVASELLCKSGLLTLNGTVLDLGCGTGYLTQKLQAMGGYQQLFALDIALPMLQMARQRLADAVHYLCADLEQLPLGEQCVDMLFSSLALQWCADLSKTLRDCQRVLKPQGRLFFATFGAATLRELKLAWSVADTLQHVNEFYSAQDIEEMLLVAGWQNINLSTHTYRCHYASVWSLMRELKGIGAHNVMQGRRQQLTSKRQLLQMLDAYPVAENGKVQATYEVIWVSAEADV